MNLVNLPPLLAEIPLLDLKGPEFLKFYAIAFAVALIASLLLRAFFFQKFNRPGSPVETLSDPYELAYLAGGEPRCAQLAVVRLLKMKAIERIRGRLRSLAQMPEALNPIEHALYVFIANHGDDGIMQRSALPAIKPYLKPIEARLAIQGLRPTQEESGSGGLSINWPLVLLAVIGIAKIFVGLNRDRPVFFLIVAVSITALVAWLVRSPGRERTKSGEAALQRHRMVHESEASGSGMDLAMMSMGLALMGPQVLATYADPEWSDPDFQRDLHAFQKPASNGSGGDGGNTGASCGGDSGGGGGDSGGSSCGGSGCGGCGGGGD